MTKQNNILSWEITTHLDVKNVKWVIKEISKHLLNFDKLIIINQDIKNLESKYLQLNSQKIKNKIKWKTKLSLKESVEWTSNWYKGFYNGQRNLCQDQIKKFEKI